MIGVGIPLGSRSCGVQHGRDVVGASGRPRRISRGTVTVRSSTSTAVDLVHLYGSGEHVDAILGSYLMILDASSSSAAESAVDNGWLTPLVEGLETVLRYIQTGFDRYHVPYSYGWSIVTLTLFVKTLTFPLTKTQVESTMSMQALKPEIDAIKDKYGDDKDAVQRETAALYEKANVNPLAGCLPTLATIPIFIGLYRSLTSVASQGDLDNQGFYWIPSLAGPTSVAAQKAGSGTAWLFPFVDGHPPVGWELASAYLVLPVALVVAQYISSAIISPPIDPNAENAKVQKALYLGLPLMIGWFSLNLPSGLSLYYFSNTVFTSAQQIFLRKLGGATLAEYDLGPIELGKARRSGQTVDATVEASSSDVVETTMDNTMSESEGAVTSLSMSMEQDAQEPALRELDRRCKRTRKVSYS
ncbi:hypothetical protein M9434_002720 [Picochlorum sp. BPE23]|nr:hypothetical protein M9434_002720 [Picochlorum sp. BPE23]